MMVHSKHRYSGLHKMAGIEIYGVEWAVQTADKRALHNYRKLYEIIRLEDDSKLEVSTSLSGSAAYGGRVNPYPGDIDFTEIVLVRAPNLQEAADAFVDRLRQNIDKLRSRDRIRFLELKIGADPQTGKSLKWDLEEIIRGYKVIPGKAGRAGKRVALNEAAQQGQMIKLDLIVQVDGDWKEVTKVIRFAYQPESPRHIADIVLLTPENLGETIYQELYFSCREARLASLISRVSEKSGFNNHQVMKKYRDLMDVEIAHYGALGIADKTSHLKLLKRWFNKLRMDRDEVSIDKLGVIFRSPVNAVNELKEMVLLIANAVSRGLLSIQEAGDQLVRFDERIGRYGSEFSPTDFRRYGEDIQFIQSMLSRGKATAAIERLLSLAHGLENWIEERAKEYLVHEILHPFAERLGIRIQDNATFKHEDLFRDVAEGDKMLYLMNRYLRHDSRVIVRKYDAGEKIIQLGDEARSCFVMLEGSATVYAGNEGVMVRQIRDIGPNSFIGEIALIHEGGRRTAEVVATAKVKALEIPKVVFEELLQDRSFRLFIEFLSTDRLMEDRSRNHREQSSFDVPPLFSNRIGKDVRTV